MVHGARGARGWCLILRQVRQLYDSKKLQQFGQAQSELRERLKTAARELVLEGDNYVACGSFADAALLYTKVRWWERE